MAGTKRKADLPDKGHSRTNATKSKQANVSAKKRRLSPQLVRIKSETESESLIESDTTDTTSTNGSANVSIDEEAAILGPSAQERGEAETDSDPMFESDTTEHSGDDGVSWPSDNEDPIKPPSKPIQDKSPKAKVHSESKAKDDGLSKRAAPVNGNATAVTTIPNSSSRESHAKQKAMASERKAAKPNADTIARTKKLWERLRRKSHVPKDERKQLVAELFDIITGHIKDFVLKHDSVRVIQTALKYANLEQREMIATELRGEYRTLAENRYAKFLVGKLLVHGDKRIRDMIVPEMYGHVRRMIKHPEASWILDDVYRGVATPTQKAILLREWYGPEYAIFKDKEKDGVTADLAIILAKQPEKRKPILNALQDLINQCIQKKTTGFTMLHDAMLQYYLNIQPGSSEATEFVELLKGDEEGDLLKNLAFTKCGARVVCLALAYSSAKDRKLILRTFKDTIQALTYDAYGHQILLVACDVIDDTVLIAKSIFPELLGTKHSSEESQGNLLGAAIHLNGRVPLLYPFTGAAKSILSYDDQELLKEIHAIRISTSKKDPEVRRKELAASLSPALLSFIESNAQDLMASSFGCQFMVDVLLSSVGDQKSALTAIADSAAENPEAASGSQSPSLGRMLKSLVQGGRYNQKTKTLELREPPLKFYDILYPKIRDSVVDWAAGGNSFVIVALLEAQGFSFTNELKAALLKGQRQITTAAEAGNKGSQLLLQKT